MLGDGLKKPCLSKGEIRGKSADYSQYSSHHWMVVFAAQRLFLPIGVVTGAVTSFLKDGVLQKMDKSWHLVDVIYY